MERNDAITTLEVLRANCSKHSRDYQALEYAINSLKTDEAYQIMYEGEEIYTKDEVIAMLTEIQLEIEELDTPNNGSAYLDCAEIIQQKIDSLQGDKE